MPDEPRRPNPRREAANAARTSSHAREEPTATEAPHDAEAPRTPRRPKEPAKPNGRATQDSPRGPTGSDLPGGSGAPGTPKGPPGGIEIPDAVLQGLPFAALDDGLPLLLLPVRVETRYRLAVEPPELRIRIYPDQVHVDADTPVPGAVEAELTREFWRRRLAARDDRGRDATWRTFARRVGARRAGWLARTLRPGTDSKGRLAFPTVEPADGRVPARPVLLPHQWLAVGYSADGLLFSVAGEEVAADLRTGPDPAATPVELEGSGLTVDDGLAWMVDYDRAVQEGMAITVPLTGEAAPAAEGVATLLVVGVDSAPDPVEAAAALDRLLDVHARTEGLAFLPQGTPTNNTRTAVAGWTATGDDAAGPPLGEDTAAAGTTAKQSARSSREAGTRPELEPVPPHLPVPSSAGDNADLLAGALGLESADTLRRAAYGTDRERERSRAMLRVLFEAVIGTFARRLLRVGEADGVAPATVDELRSWATQWVTGGAPLPTLSIGPQPYGVLPVRRSAPAQPPETTAQHLESVVSLLIGEWRRAVANVPAVDPDIIDQLPEGEHETRIAAILASEPHPARLFLRWVDQFASLSDLDQRFTPQGLFWLFLATLDPELNPAYASPLVEIVALYGFGTLHDQPQTIDQQIDAWQDVHDGLPEFLAGFGHADMTDDGQDLIRVVLDLLAGWRRRQDPLLSLDLLRFEGMLGETNTELVEAVMDDNSSEWGDEGLVQARDVTPEVTAAAYLADLRRRFADAAPGDELTAAGIDFAGREPLLHALLDATLALVPADAAERSRVTAALDLLAARPPDELDWLTRETIGLGTNRLDAWATSLASERLSRMRAARPDGIQIGAFGWVTGLVPRREERPSAGFVHAPSMAHAATAAVLRSGWLAHGSRDALAPAAVDLRSHRVREATWLLDGVRNGLDLGDLLGWQFERSLHDAAADEHIRPTRLKVLRATRRTEEPPSEPVDGISLLDLDRANGLGTVAQPVRDALDALEDSFDAANDVGLFEAVHQLTGANLERATALLDALATGTGSPPELRGTAIPRAAVPIEHRVVILLEEEAQHPGRGWASTGERDRLAPPLAAWVASLLPNAGTVGFIATPVPVVGGAARPSQPMRLAELRLGALDALWLVGDDPLRPPAPLATLAGAVAGTAVTIDPSARGDAVVSLTEFTVLATELRRSIDGLRVADARDLRPAATAGEPDTDDLAALDRVDAAVTEFDRLVDDLDDAIQNGTPAAVRPVAERLARIGLATGQPAGDVAAAQALLALAVQRLQRVGAVTVDTTDRRLGLEGRVVALFGGRVPLLAGFPADGSVPFTADLTAPGEVDDWLDATGRVRAALGRLTTAGMLSELLDPDAGLRAVAGQHPLEPGEGWAATSAPVGRGGRLSVVAVTGTALPTGARVCGLVVDRWNEPVPRSEQVTGVTFQFDAPGNRPPQSWLLAVPPDNEQWSLALVLDTLLETLEWATLRAVAPEDLLAYGRAIPTVFSPGGITTWPVAATAARKRERDRERG